jgi:hypothetical protein
MFWSFDLGELRPPYFANGFGTGWLAKFRAIAHASCQSIRGYGAKTLLTSIPGSLSLKLRPLVYWRCWQKKYSA